MNEIKTGDDALDNTAAIEPSELSEKSLPVLQRWGLTEADFTEIVDTNPSLRGVTLGYVAEWKFQKMFLEHQDILAVRKENDHNRKRKGDRTFNYKGQEVIVEVKSLQTNTVKKQGDTWIGKTQVDASDRRKVTFKDGTSLETTCLLRNEFDILAVNCFAFGDGWKFGFAKNIDLPQNTYKKYTEMQKVALLPTLITVSWPPQPPFVEDIFILLDDLVAVRERGIAPEMLAEEIKLDEDGVRI